MGESSEYKTRKRPVTTATALEALLRDFQADAEERGSEATKQRRRLLLRGFRAGLWVMADRPDLNEVAQALRAELFGHRLPAVADEENELCQSGTEEEVVK
ncbi:hypothetical protein HU718_021445 [Pseudomonas tensinigenes]|jgi:hypothetical protein|uniref:Uncharacterized protein n=1 Tax=Pseudomonas tensinigenes TaxID=2745511 RepID=A0ABX8PTZ4_9PSED|nr:hypothetical protein [Pseudomonas tensinigenes]QXI04586.1 hypothetical protein HU718_021445 [Pseudomonas tensinigenes]